MPDVQRTNRGPQETDEPLAWVKRARAELSDEAFMEEIANVVADLRAVTDRYEEYRREATAEVERLRAVVQPAASFLHYHPCSGEMCDWAKNLKAALEAVRE